MGNALKRAIQMFNRRDRIEKTPPPSYGTSQNERVLNLPPMESTSPGQGGQFMDMVIDVVDPSNIITPNSGGLTNGILARLMSMLKGRSA